jgi:hypothetical protein
MKTLGIKRIVDTSFWTDGKVDDFSPEDKYFMLYLLTNPFSTQLGIYEISIKQCAFQLGYSVDAVKVLIERFENKYGMIVYSPETSEIAIKNFLRHSIMKGGAPVRDCLIKEIKKVKNRGLIARVFAHIKDSEALNETVKKIITEYEEKNGTLYYSNEIHNENENENDVSYHDSFPESYDESSEGIKKKSKKETTHPLFESLLPNYNISDALKQKLGEWIAYKTERNEQYKEQGLKSLLRQVENNQCRYGEQAVCELIEESMANLWKGIIFDRLKKNDNRTNARKEIVPHWCTESADDAMNKALERSYKTVAEDDSVRERAEKLRRELGAKA